MSSSNYNLSHNNEKHSLIAALLKILPCDTYMHQSARIYVKKSLSRSLD